MDVTKSLTFTIKIINKHTKEHSLIIWENFKKIFIENSRTIISMLWVTIKNINMDQR